jgi:cobalt-zinc-cadmium efflux system outer membrane protein
MMFRIHRTLCCVVFAAGLVWKFAGLPVAGAEPPQALTAGNDRTAAASMTLGASAVPPMAIPTDAPATLPEFEAVALRSHPRLRSAMAAVEQSRGQAVQARLYPNPVLSGGSPQISGPDSQWYGFATQELVTAGKLRLAQQAALREVQKAEYELIRARFDVLTGVRDDFYRLLVAQRRLEIFKLLLDIATRSYRIGQELAKAGEESRADVLFWSIERDRAEVRYRNASVYVDAGRRRLAASIGLPRADIDYVEGDLFMPLPDFDLKPLQEAVVRNNSLPRAAAAEIARAQWATERAVVQPIPNITLLGGYQRQVDLPPDDQGLVELMVEVPLFNRNQGNIRTTRAEIASARADLRDIELTLAETTANTIAIYRTSQRQTRWFEEYILPKARETVAVTQLLYSQGEITFLNLLEAQRILNQTELDYVQAQEDRWRAAVEIANLLQLPSFPPTPADPGAFVLAEEDEQGQPLPPPIELVPTP